MDPRNRNGRIAIEQKRVRMWARVCAAIVGVAAMAVAVVAAADPPSRVARLAQVEGTVSFAPAGDDQWVQASVNRPLVAGDRLWFDQGSRGEVQMTNAALRFGPLTSVSLLNIDDRIEQLQLTQGVVQMNVRRIGEGESIEIDTPNVAFSITRAGAYRFEIDPQNDSTLVVVRDGEGDAYGEGAAYRLAAGQAFRFYGTNLRDHEYLTPPAPDGFERWALARQNRYERTVAARYVAPGVVGYEDLDQFGTWQAVADYGEVWIPRSVPAGWAPYRYGHWVWVDPWGWTWVDDAPWGFAPFHYGRWAFVQSRWCWVPGPREERAVYAPALVAFVGGRDFSVSVASGAIGWVPLAPREVYVPPYTVSREYFTRVNVTNTVVNNNYVVNFYNNRDTAHLRYAHMERAAAVTVVPQTAFVQAQPVHRAAVAVNPQVLSKAEVLPLAKIAPERTSFAGAAQPATARPPAAALQKPAVAKASPPPPPAPIDTRLQRLRAEPGKPIESPARPPQGAQPSPQGGQAAAPHPNVQVLQAMPPQPAPTAPTPRGRERAERPQGPTEGSSATASPPTGAPPSAPPGQQRRAESPTPAPAPPTSQAEPRRGPPMERAAPPQPAPPPSVQAEPRRGPPMERAAPPQPAPPPSAQAEPRRGPPMERAAPPQPAPPPQAQTEPRRGPPMERAAPPQPAPPPQAQAEPRRGPPVERAAPPQPTPSPAAPPGRPEARAPAAAPPAAQVAPEQREGNKGKGRSDDRKEGEPKG